MSIGAIGGAFGVIGGTLAPVTAAPSLATVAGGEPLAIVTTPGGSAPVSREAMQGRTIYVVHTTVTQAGSYAPLAALGPSLGGVSGGMLVRTDAAGVSRIGGRVQTTGGTAFPAFTDPLIRVPGERQVSVLTVPDGITSARYRNSRSTNTSTVSITPGTGLMADPSLWLATDTANDTVEAVYAFPAHDTATEDAVMAYLAAQHLSGHYQKNILYNRTGSSTSTLTERATANLDYLSGWEAWRGAPATVFGDFTASGSWSEVDAYSDEHNGWSRLPAGCYLNLGVPILIPGTNLRAGASGAYTVRQPDGSDNGTLATYRNLANGFVTRGMGGRVIYRIAWEFNAKTSFPWGLNGNNAGGNPSYGEGNAAQGVAEFIAYWQLIVQDIRAVDPDAIIHWCPINGWDGTGETIESMYPGDEWVDMVGSDLYDNDYRGASGLYANLQYGSTMPDADRAVLHQRVWDEFLRSGNQGYGLDWQADFAADHGKMLGFGEWSNYMLNNTPFGSETAKGWGGGDNPTMVQNLWDYLQAQRARGTTVLDVHYDASVSDGNFAFYPEDTTLYPNAAAKYRALWGTVA